MAKRKSKTKGQRHEAPNLEFAVDYTELWAIPANYGRRYARVSGDINPIHTYKLFAKAMGFKTSILHGWYSVGRLVKHAEELNGRPYQSIEVAFKSPVYLPSTQRLSLGQGQGTTPFMLHDEKTHQLVLSGSLR
jgi:acyl dehydratase